MRACRLTSTSAVRALGINTAMPWATRRWNSTADAKAEAPKEGAEAAAAGSSSAAADEKVAALQKQLDDKTAEAKELKEKMMYALADADNARRVAKIDIDKAKDFSVTSIAKDMLEVVDTLARAIEAFTKLDKETETKAHQILTGVKMSQNVLLSNLGRHGIEKMKVEKGAKFDPKYHEALFQAPATAEVPADHVSAVVKEGYTIKDRVLRAAQVGVAEKQ